ncbi:MAG: hypothetical protein H6642_19155 [Caldilineaceae bacterium]|nr:hypothetical protein [Caldilineaceae bacterium]
MTNLSELTTTALLALCTLWIVCGFVLLQSAQTGLLTPGWAALLAFFAVGTLGKTLAALARQEHMQRPQPMRLMLTA